MAAIIPDKNDKDEGDNLFSGDAKLAANTTDGEEAKESVDGEELFSGDITALDPAALAAQAAELEKLMESMEENLETTELDINQEEAVWSEAAKLSTEDDMLEEEDNGNSHHSPAVNLFDVAHKINQIAVKTLDEEEEELLNEIQKSKFENLELMEDAKRLQEDNNFPTADEDEEEEDDDIEEESESEDDGEVEVDDDMSIDEDMSIDDSASDSMESSASPLSSYSREDENNIDADDENESDNQSERSAKSLSLEEIEGEDEDFIYEMGSSQKVLLQNGILRIDPTSDREALVCDWKKWRKWRRQASQHERSSQRWADGSLQDCSLKMPERKGSDDDLSRATASDTDNNSAASDGSFFDWKAWRRRKGSQQQSSTSRTNSFSVSDDDGFDPNSVLSKLDEWEEMEASQQDHSNNSSKNDASNSTLGDETNATSASTQEARGGQKLNRANSEKKESRRPSIPMRAHSDHSLNFEGGEDSQQQWKDWQREQRKSRMQGSWSSSHIQDADSEGDETDSQRSFAADGSSCEDGFALEEGDEGEATAPHRTQSEKLNSNNPRPGLSLRSNSMQAKRPSVRSLHVSPMRSPMQKSPKVGDQWKAWQIEKRRSGMMKKTLSSNSGWGLPFNEDAGDASQEGTRTKLQKSQSEKWDKKQENIRKNGDKRPQIQRAQSLHIPKTDGGSVFDWKAYRKNQKRNAKGMQRSQSDRWASSPSVAATSEQDKPPSAPQLNGLRRAQSDSDVMQIAAAKSKQESPQGQVGNSDIFDWKAFRKERRRSLKKSTSGRLKIEVTS